MAKNSLPESMDLLLDTMCNTFGGVMFIAIALSLALFAGQIKKPVRPPENEAEKLEKMQAEQRQLEQEKSQLDSELADVRQKSRAGEKNALPLAAEIAGLENQSRQLDREYDTVEQKLRSAEAKQAHMRERNDTAEAQNRETAREQERQQRKNDSDRRELEKQIAALKSRLKQLPQRKLHFALQEKTDKRPYVAVIRGGELCRLGTNSRVSSAEVKVRLDGNVATLFPQRGYALAMISGSNITQVLPCDRSRHFLWIIVHPDSFAEFVHLRRLLRQYGYQVYWYVERNPVLYYGRSSGYNASF